MPRLKRGSVLTVAGIASVTIRMSGAMDWKMSTTILQRQTDEVRSGYYVPDLHPAAAGSAVHCHSAARLPDNASAAMTRDIQWQLSRGKLWQVCPQCKRNEAAGPHCSRCGYRTGSDDWFPNGDLERELTARDADRDPTNQLGFRSLVERQNAQAKQAEKAEKHE